MRRTGSPVQGEDLLDCWERDQNYPPEFCQIHGDKSSYDTSDSIVLRKEFVMLYPEFMEYRRRRKGAAAPIDGRGSGRRMDDPHRHSRGLIRVQAAAGTDHHRRRSELDRDLGVIWGVILGVEARGLPTLSTSQKGP